MRIFKSHIDHKAKERIKELDVYDIMDTEIEEEFQSMVELASELLDCPIALISLLDNERQWFKAVTGLNVRETPIEFAFCHRAIEQDEVFVVEDATKDSRFVNNPLVTGEPHIRFYSGYPLKTSNAINIGTLCVIDNQPRSFTEKDKKVLVMLGRQVLQLLEKRRLAREVELYKSYLSTVNDKGTSKLIGAWLYDKKCQELILPRYITEKIRKVDEGFNGDHLSSFQSYLPQAYQKLVNRSFDQGFQFHSIFKIGDVTTELAFVISDIGFDVIKGYVYHVKEDFLLQNVGQSSIFSSLEIFNGLEVCVSLINSRGTLVWVNDKWLKFAHENGGNLDSCGIGVNYLSVCEKARGKDSDEAKNVASGIKRIISGEIDSFQQEYPCHSPSEKRYFLAMMNKVVLKGSRYVLIVHENITQNVILEEKVKQANLIADQRNDLVKEAHHRVKNNLEIVKSLLYLQQNQMTDESVRSILETSTRRINTIALIHEKMYSEDSAGTINISEYIQELTTLLLSNVNTEIKPQLNIVDVEVPVKKVNPFGMIISELISNSIKYAFTDVSNPVIRIDFRKYGGNYKLIYNDNGVGFDAETVRKGLGTNLIKSLAGQLKAKSDLVSNPIDGTTYIFSGIQW